MEVNDTLHADKQAIFRRIFIVVSKSYDQPYRVIRVVATLWNPEVPYLPICRIEETFAKASVSSCSNQNHDRKERRSNNVCH